MMQMNDLKKQYVRLKPLIDARMQAVLDHGQYILGPEVTELENTLADFIGVKHAIGVSNGTDALLMALMALDIQPGDEVITTPFTFIATVEMIVLAGAKPVFVDINPDTYLMDAAQIESRITARTRAIMPVSLYGQCPDFDAINAVAEKHGIAVIEDGAQSFGATYKNRRSLGLSSIGCTSFFPSKPLGCYGDGGMCFTDDDRLAKALRQIRAHGQEKRYEHVRLGLNGRLDTLQAAVLLAKWPSFQEEVLRRQAIADTYTAHLQSYVKTPHVVFGSTSVFAQYTIAVTNRDALQAHLKTRGIPTAVHYPIPAHVQPAYRNLTDERFPISEAAAKQVLSLPMHADLTENELTIITQAVIEHCEALVTA